MEKSGRDAGSSRRSNPKVWTRETEALPIAQEQQSAHLHYALFQHLPRAPHAAWVEGRPYLLAPLSSRRGHGRIGCRPPLAPRGQAACALHFLPSPPTLPRRTCNGRAPRANFDRCSERVMSASSVAAAQSPLAPPLTKTVAINGSPQSLAVIAPRVLSLSRRSGNNAPAPKLPQPK